MINQKMMLACMRGMTGHMAQLEREVPLHERDVLFSFLPLAHIFGRWCMPTWSCQDFVGPECC